MIDVESALQDSSAINSPQELVESAYRLISFGAGGEPAATDFGALFTEHAVLALRVLPEDPSISIMTPRQYIERLINGHMKERGYEERPLETSFRVLGDLAEAHVRFQMFLGKDHIGDAMDIFQIVRQNGRWRIVAITSEIVGH